jgi:hypothetical protein
VFASNIQVKRGKCRIIGKLSCTHNMCSVEKSWHTKKTFQTGSKFNQQMVLTAIPFISHDQLFFLIGQLNDFLWNKRFTKAYCIGSKFNDWSKLKCSNHQSLFCQWLIINIWNTKQYNNSIGRENLISSRLVSKPVFYPADSYPCIRFPLLQVQICTVRNLILKAINKIKINAG